MTRFHTKLHEGYLHNQENGTSRYSRWIVARDIPLSLLTKYGTPKDNPQHPHNIPGLAWDMSSANWRVVRNASSLSEKLIDVAAVDGTFQL